MPETPQANFWAGDFGVDYIPRNKSGALLASNLSLFSRVLASTNPRPTRVLELGANIGMNYLALREILPELEFSGVEVNHSAATELASLGPEVYESSIESFETQQRWDLVFTKGVLIHLNPSSLPGTYEKMVNLSSQYILIAEYYNPVPVSIDYRGEKDKLFKRDFAGELMDLFPNVKLRDYGFVYRRGPFPQDDISWFLMEKS